MDIVGWLTLLGLAATIIIALIPFLWKRYFTRPELAIEIVNHMGPSMNVGISNQNIPNEKGYIDGNNAIYVFHLKWRISLIIRNNSDRIAYYPKIYFEPAEPHLLLLEKLNSQKPIMEHEEVTLKAEYGKYEEKRGQERSTTAILPPELTNMRILIEYKNSAKIKFYTLYDQSKAHENNIFTKRKPSGFNIENYKN